MKFKIIERGGQTIERQLQHSNPTTSDQCHRSNCGPCDQPGGNGGRKKCHVNNIVYKYVCQVPGCTGVYVGETSKNMYTRNLGHNDKYLKKQKESFMYNHQIEKHGGAPANFKIKVLQSFKDCLSRQAAEATFISRTPVELLNSKAEFFQPPIVQVRKEIQRGL